MRTLFIIPLVLMSLVSFPSWGLTMDDLVQREGLYYQKFTDVPFTGELNEGSFRGLFKDGRIEGYFEIYLLGRLTNRGFLSNGKKEGKHEIYHPNGQLFAKGNFNNDKQDGMWFVYNDDGTVDLEATGTFKNGVKVSD